MKSNKDIAVSPFICYHPSTELPVQELFRTLVGPVDYRGVVTWPPFDLARQTLSVEAFRDVMTQLPHGSSVSPREADMMFAVADRDGNGHISYREFRRMCVVPKLEPIPDKPPTSLD